MKTQAGHLKILRNCGYFFRWGNGIVSCLFVFLKSPSYSDMEIHTNKMYLRFASKLCRPWEWMVYRWDEAGLELIIVEVGCWIHLVYFCIYLKTFTNYYTMFSFPWTVKSKRWVWLEPQWSATQPIRLSQRSYPTQPACRASLPGPPPSLTVCSVGSQALPCMT